MAGGPGPDASPRCPACGCGSVAAVHLATERMYGLGGRFAYRECQACASLALNEVPDDLERYYPQDYYAFAMPPSGDGGSPVPRTLRRWATRTCLASPAASAVVMAASRALGRDLPAWTRLLAELGIGFDAAIVDVGCGDGHRLRTLRRHGFGNLTGSDPRLPEAVAEPGLRLTPAPLADLAGPFDLVMFHHSLEHVRNPGGALAATRRALSPGGAALVRIPLAGSWAWRTYGTSWVQLDAPRHHFVPTTGGMHLLAARSGFGVAGVVYDSEPLQLWGSQRYQRGLPLHGEPAEPGPADGPGSTPPPGLAERAAELNARGDGDQAAFLLRPTAPSERVATPGAPTPTRTRP